MSLCLKRISARCISEKSYLKKLFNVDNYSNNLNIWMYKMKKVILITLLISCYFAWNNISPDQRTDSLLKLVAKINPFNVPIVVDLDKKPNLIESNIESEFKGAYFACANEIDALILGDRVCWAYITSFNGIPADIVAFFFKNGDYKFLRVGIDKKNHDQLKLFIDNKFTYMGVNPNSRSVIGQDLGVWLSKSGRITTTIEKPLMDEPSVLLWQKT